MIKARSQGPQCLAAVALAIYPGAVIGGIVAYLIAWFIMPADGRTLQPVATS